MLLSPRTQPQPTHFYHEHQQRSSSLYPHDQLEVDPPAENNAITSPSHPSLPQPQITAGSRASSLVFDAAHHCVTLGQSHDENLLGLSPSSTTSILDRPTLSQDIPAELMQSDSWYLGDHFIPKSVGRLSHNRESSLSSLGSAGPASPFSQTTSNPHIAVTDSASDGFGDVQSQDNSYYQLAKTLGPSHDSLYSSYHSFSADSADMSYQPAMHRFKGERVLLPAPELSISAGPNRSHPASVASSVAGDSPATPSLGEPEDDRRRKAAFHSVPKLDRTMTDVYSDELYSPNFAITSASPSHIQIPMSPHHDVFAQRLHAANNQHLTAASHSPVATISRSRSPFRQGSPLAPAPALDFGSSTTTSQLRFSSAQQMREQHKADHDAQAIRQQMVLKSEPETPKTISPKDAILEFHESDGVANFPLFPPQDAAGFLYDQLPKQRLPQIDNNTFQSSQQDSTNGNGSFSYMASQLAAGLPVPQQYPFIANNRLTHDSSPRLSSSESSAVNSPAGLHRPVAVECGTYTCTYHGCTLRFDTPALLQKHKREGHRQAQGLTSPHRPDAISAAAAGLMTQAGPHRCDRINPSTGKPCSTIFSRPYDLTRHEDTIHNARKLKVRCDLCTEEKTFSRADALTRHYRVCHPDVEFPGRQRRRGHN